MKNDLKTPAKIITFLGVLLSFVIFALFVIVPKVEALSDITESLSTKSVNQN